MVFEFREEGVTDPSGCSVTVVGETRVAGDKGTRGGVLLDMMDGGDQSGNLSSHSAGTQPE